MAASLEVVYGAGLPTVIEPPESLALKAASQELMVTKSKLEKALEAHRGVEFQVILPMETEFLEVPATDVAHRMEF
jgi:hypothetical protein